MNTRNAINPGAMFALTLTGDALAPRLRDRDTVVIDPDKEAKPGDTLLVDLDHNPSRRAVMFLNGDGDLVDARRGFVPSGCYSVVGPVVGVRHASDPNAPAVERKSVRRAVRRIRRSHRPRFHGGKRDRRRRQGGEARRVFLSALVVVLLAQAGVYDLTPTERVEARRVLAKATPRDMKIARRMVESVPDLSARNHKQQRKDG